MLDEYLAGLVRHADLMQDARPWANYETDYAPLVHFAKDVGMPVIAANAPRRYVGAVGRDPDALRGQSWPSDGPASLLSWLPALPLPTPSEAYERHLRDDPAVVRVDLIGVDDEFAGAHHGGQGGGDGSAGLASGGADGGEQRRRCPFIGLEARDGLRAPMLLWDATMGQSIARALDSDPGRLVVHVCGSFHCERKVGIADMVEAYRERAASTNQVVIVMYPEDDCHRFVPRRHAGAGDFVILTDATVRRSHDYMMDTRAGLEQRGG